ncbi:hypothetical protein [Viridibacillus arvi]|uniref:hypothetical protein n=1 Tax=Viridibacillus arvi TaxID=263475 RepID=UPI0034CD9F87
MAEIIITFILMLPLYGLLIWSYFEPEESILWGKRWMYKEEHELSSGVIRYTKITSLAAMIFLTVMFFVLILINVL